MGNTKSTQEHLVSFRLLQTPKKPLTALVLDKEGMLESPGKIIWLVKYRLTRAGQTIYLDGDQALIINKEGRTTTVSVNSGDKSAWVGHYDRHGGFLRDSRFNEESLLHNSDRCLDFLPDKTPFELKKR